MSASLVRELVLAAILVVLFVVFSIAAPGFANAENLLRQVLYWVPVGLVALSMTLIMATGGIDLSVGSMLAVSGVTMGLLQNDTNLPFAACVPIGLAVGAIAGAVNGAAVAYGRVPPLVVTLATMALFRGIAMGLSEARALGGYPRWTMWLADGWAPPAIILLALAGVAAWFILHRSWFGRYTELLGENETAAKFSAMPTATIKLVIYTVSGVVCGIAALCHLAIYGVAKADMAGGLELEAIACVVLGGTRISGGRATIAGTLLGLAIIGILRYGLQMTDIPGLRTQHIVIIVGLLLIVTAVVNERLGRENR